MEQRLSQCWDAYEKPNPDCNGHRLTTHRRMEDGMHLLYEPGKMRRLHPRVGKVGGTLQNTSLTNGHLKSIVLCGPLTLRPRFSYNKEVSVCYYRTPAVLLVQSLSVINLPKPELFLRRLYSYVGGVITRVTPHISRRRETTVLIGCCGVEQTNHQYFPLHTRFRVFLPGTTGRRALFDKMLHAATADKKMLEEPTSHYKIKTSHVCVVRY